MRNAFYEGDFLPDYSSFVKNLPRILCFEMAASLRPSYILETGIVSLRALSFDRNFLMDCFLFSNPLS